jgi:hypothetical protein
MAIRASFAGRVGDLGVDENRHPITAERSGSRLSLGECPEGGTIMVSAWLMMRSRLASWRIALAVAPPARGERCQRGFARRHVAVRRSVYPRRRLCARRAPAPSRQYLHGGCSRSWCFLIRAQRAVEYHLSHFVCCPRTLIIHPPYTSIEQPGHWSIRLAVNRRKLRAVTLRSRTQQADALV